MVKVEKELDQQKQLVEHLVNALAQAKAALDIAKTQEEKLERRISDLLRRKKEPTLAGTDWKEIELGETGTTDDGS